MNNDPHNSWFQGLSSEERLNHLRNLSPSDRHAKLLTLPPDERNWLMTQLFPPANSNHPQWQIQGGPGIQGGQNYGPQHNPGITGGQNYGPQHNPGITGGQNYGPQHNPGITGGHNYPQHNPGITGGQNYPQHNSGIQPTHTGPTTPIHTGSTSFYGGPTTPYNYQSHYASGERVIDEQQHLPEAKVVGVMPGGGGYASASGGGGYASASGGEPIRAEKKQKEKKYKIGPGSVLKNFYVHKKKELNNNKDIWVCKVTNRARSGANVNIHVDDEVLVPFDHINYLSDDDDDDDDVDDDNENVAPKEANLKIGSWNIRCTKQFQEPSMFFTGLIQRFARLAEVICAPEVNCDIVALQELPIKFTNVDIDLKADDILPELVDQLDKYSNMNGSNDKWGVAYSEDFPQDVWMYQRDKEKLKKKYDRRNGVFIHAFVYKTNKITCHSVEQVLDLRLQESLFKHAPSLGRFTFEDTFHFSLCNVHMRPYISQTDCSFDEIKYLGECIPELSKYNPNSTILLGDWNMSAVQYAPSSDHFPVGDITEFPPYVDGTWKNIRKHNYTQGIQNCYTNTSGDKQYDNIWIPEALKNNQKCRRKGALKVERPTGKEEYSRTDNVVDLSSFFTGGTRSLQNAVTDHNLVYVDLEIDLTIKSELIKKVLEINISENDGVAESSQPDSNMYEGNSKKTKSNKKTSPDGKSSKGEVDNEDGGTKVKKGRKSLKGEVDNDNEGGDTKVKERKSLKGEVDNDNEGGDTEVKERKSSLDGKSESNNPPNLNNARTHFSIWNRTDDTSLKAMGDTYNMDSRDARYYWSMNLFPPGFHEQDSDVYRNMKTKESEYLELLSQDETKELKKSKKTALKDFKKLAESEYSSFINHTKNDDDDDADANNSSTV